MTTEDPGRDTRIVELRGRAIAVRQLTDAQMMFMAREAKLVQSKSDTLDRGRILSAGARIFDTLESMVVQDADREFLIDEVVAGNLDLDDMMPFITAFKEPEEKPRVRRGRPPAKRA